jgi:hypothetical protein
MNFNNGTPAGNTACWPVHPTAFPVSGHSVSTKDFYSRLSFLNAATEKPGQTPRDRVPQIPQKTRLLWARLDHHRLALSFARAGQSATIG